MQRILLALVAGVVALPLAPALTSARTSGPAGEGAATISGYTISNVRYTPNPTNPRQLQAVSFTIDPAQAETVQVRLHNADTWHSCTVTADTVSCGLQPGQADLADISALEVIAS